MPFGLNYFPGLIIRGYVHGVNVQLGVQYSDGVSIGDSGEDILIDEIEDQNSAGCHQTNHHHVNYPPQGVSIAELETEQLIQGKFID